MWKLGKSLLGKKKKKKQDNENCFYIIRKPESMESVAPEETMPKTLDLAPNQEVLPEKMSKFDSKSPKKNNKLDSPSGKRFSGKPVNIEMPKLAPIGCIEEFAHEEDEAMQKFWSKVLPNAVNPAVGIERELWFHGTLSGLAANSLLKRPGQFLVRQRPENGLYVLSTYALDGQVYNIVLTDESHRVIQIPGCQFEKIIDLINYLQSRQHDIQLRPSLLVVLNEPVVCAKFANLSEEVDPVNPPYDVPRENCIAKDQQECDKMTVGKCTCVNLPELSSQLKLVNILDSSSESYTTFISGTPNKFCTTLNSSTLSESLTTFNSSTPSKSNATFNSGTSSESFSALNSPTFPVGVDILPDYFAPPVPIEETNVSSSLLSTENSSISSPSKLNLPKQPRSVHFADSIDCLDLNQIPDVGHLDGSIYSPHESYNSNPSNNQFSNEHTFPKSILVHDLSQFASPCSSFVANQNSNLQQLSGTSYLANGNHFLKSNEIHGANHSFESNQNPNLNNISNFNYQAGSSNASIGNQFPKSNIVPDLSSPAVQSVDQFLNLNQESSSNLFSGPNFTNDLSKLPGSSKTTDSIPHCDSIQTVRRNIFPRSSCKSLSYLKQTPATRTFIRQKSFDGHDESNQLVDQFVGFNQNVGKQTNSGIPPSVPPRKTYGNRRTLSPPQTLSVATGLNEQTWFHPQINRERSEQLLRHNGDFLVRPSSEGGYVLSTRQNGEVWHINLVDQHGNVKIGHIKFQTINQLIRYSMMNEKPVISANGLLAKLEHPIRRPFPLPEMPHYIDLD